MSVSQNTNEKKKKHCPSDKTKYELSLFMLIYFLLELFLGLNKISGRQTNVNKF